MSLKGYQWLNDDGEVIMYFTFKDLTITICKDTTEVELKKFEDYITSKSFDVYYLNTNGYKVKNK